MYKMFVAAIVFFAFIALPQRGQACWVIMMEGSEGLLSKDLNRTLKQDNPQEFLGALQMDCTEWEGSAKLEYRPRNNIRLITWVEDVQKTGDMELAFLFLRKSDWIKETLKGLRGEANIWNITPGDSQRLSVLHEVFLVIGGTSREAAPILWYQEGPQPGTQKRGQTWGRMTIFVKSGAQLSEVERLLNQGLIDIETLPSGR